MSPRQLGRPPTGLVAEANGAEDLCHSVPDFILRAALPLQSVGDILLDRHVRKQGVGLEHQVDGSMVRRNRQKVTIINHHRSGVRVLESGKHPQQRRLAAAGRTQQGEELVLMDFQTDGIQCDHVTE